MNLSEIKFTVETGALDSAIDKIAQLKASVGTLKETAATRKDSLTVQREEIKTAKEQERLERERLKTIEQGIKTSKAQASASKASGDAVEDTSEKMSAATKAVEKQVLSMKVLRAETWATTEGIINLGEGFTKSQANSLANLKLTGATSEQLMMMAHSYQELNRIMGINTFDNSASGLAKMTKQLRELEAIEKLVGAGFSLTKDQIIEFVRENERTIQQFKSEGRTTEELTQALEKLGEKYLTTGTALNKRIAASKEMERVAKEQARSEIKAANDIAKANEYIEKELAKIVFAADEVNAALNKSASNGIFNFEAALKRSGMTADKQAEKLLAYRNAQQKVAEAEKKNQADYITRAVGPQITDIFVGLATGQSPLTIMLQQGGQLRDQFSQMKVDSKDMAAVMKNAMSTMVVSIKDTAFAITSLLGGAIKDAGTGLTNFFVNGVKSAALETRAMVIALTQGKDAADKFKVAMSSPTVTSSMAMRGLALAATAVGATVAVATAYLAAYTYALVKTNKAENELSRSLLLTGASLGMNVKQASELIKTQGDLGRSMSDTRRVLTAMAKEGGFTQEQFLLINQAAIELERVGGPKIEETVKRFAKFKDEPVKALRELQVQTGLVNEETLKSIQSYEKRGEAVKAATLADKEAARVLQEVAKEYEENAGFWTNLGIRISKAFEPLTNILDELTRIKGPLDDLAAARYKLQSMEGSKNGLLGSSEAQINAQKDVVKRLEEQVRVQEVDNAWRKKTSAQAGAQLKIENDLVSVTKVQNEQLAKTLSLNDYIAKRRESIGADKMKFATAEQLKQYDELFKKEYEAQNKQSQAADNSLQTIKQAYENQKSEIQAQLQGQLEIKKFYQQLELGDMQENLDSQNNLITQSFGKRYAALKTFGDEYSAALSKAIKKEADPQKRSNLVNQQKNIPGMLAAEKEKINTDYIKVYEGEIREALKAWQGVSKQLDDVNRKEEELIAKRRRENDLKIASISLSPMDQAIAAAKVEEQNRQAEVRHQLDMAQKEAERRTADITFDRDRAIRNKADPDVIEGLDDLIGKQKAEQDAVASSITAWEDKRKAMVDAAGEQGKMSYMIDVFTKFTEDATKTNFGQVLADQFGIAAGGVGSMIDALNRAGEAKIAYETLHTKEADPKKREALEDKYFQGQVNNYAKMAGAAKNFFGKKTAAAKVAYGVEASLQAISIAMSLHETAVKVGGYLEEMAMAGASEATKTALAEAGWFARMGIYASEIMAKFTAVMGPWGLAAGAAAVVALGLSSGSSGSFTPSNEGTGTVLGDKSAKSQSLGNSFQRLLDVDTMQLKHSAEMLTSLRSIDNNTKVLGIALVRSGAIDIGKSGEGIATGKFDTNLSNGVANVGRAGMAAVTFGVSELLGLGKAFDSLAKSLFGSTTKIEGQGIFSGEQNLGKVLSGGFDAQYFSDVLTKKKTLGFTTSKSRSTRITDEGTSELDRQLTLIFSNMVDVLETASKPLGVSFQDIADRINKTNISIGKVDLQGLSGQEVTEKLQAVFSKVGDEMAKQIIPGFEEFTKVGEGYFDTVTRVATGVEYATSALEMLGISAIDFRNITEKQGDVDTELIRDSILATEGLNGISKIIKSFGGEAENLVDAYQSLTGIRESLKGIGLVGDIVGFALIEGARGLDELQSSVTAFSDLLPESERLSLATESLRAKFKLLGIDSMPATAEAFVSLVKGVDTSTEAGQVLLGKLLGLSDAFKTVADQSERVKTERLGLEEELLKLQNNTAELRKKELESLDPSNRALQEQIWLLQDQKTATEELTKALESAGKSIQDEINRLRGVTSTSGSGTLQAQFAINTASARAGNVDALKSLPDLSKAIESATISSASTELEVARMKAFLATSLSQTMQTLGLSTDASGNVSVGSSLTGTTSGTSASGSALIVDKTNQELLTELKTLNAKVADLEAAAVATALSNSKMHKILDRVAADGNNFSVVVNTEAAPVQVQTV